MKIHFPVFVLAKDCGEVCKFESLYEMQQQLEETDIQNGEYNAWDCDGLSLDLQVQKPVWLSIEPSSSGLQGEQLAEALKKYASDVGAEVKIMAMTAVEFKSALHQIKEHIAKPNAPKGLLRRITRRRT